MILSDAPRLVLVTCHRVLFGVAWFAGRYNVGDCVVPATGDRNDMVSGARLVGERCSAVMTRVVVLREHLKPFLNRVRTKGALAFSLRVAHALFDGLGVLLVSRAGVLASLGLAFCESIRSQWLRIRLGLAMVPAVDLQRLLAVLGSPLAAVPRPALLAACISPVRRKDHVATSGRADAALTGAKSGDPGAMAPSVRTIAFWVELTRAARSLSGAVLTVRVRALIRDLVRAFSPATGFHGMQYTLASLACQGG